ncbi:MAG: DNA translocase FtsK 4TM domain-containing protein [Tidjanibacter sp.]|nr:DNA translocase FtsK 4TM domain-containing protein [Tidjanibacter sp.]
MATQKRNTKPSASKREEVKEEAPKRKLTLNDNHRWVICFILFFISAFTILAILSHYFTWRQAQMGEVANAGGELGELIAELLVGRCFGIFALCVPAMGLVLSAAVRKSENIRLLKVAKVLLLLMIIGSVTMGFIADTNGDIFGYGLGGGIGIDIARWLSTKIGHPGLGLLLFVCWILLGVYVNSSKTIEIVNMLGSKVVSVFRRRGESEDDDEQSDRVLAGGDDEEEYGGNGDEEEYGRDGDNEDEAGREEISQAPTEPDFTEVPSPESPVEQQPTEGEGVVTEVPWYEDKDAGIIVPPDEPLYDGPEVQPEQVQEPAPLNGDFIEVDGDGVAIGMAGAVGAATAARSRYTTPKPVDNDGDFTIVENTEGAGMTYVKSSDSPADVVVGTGGIVESTEDGGMQVVQSEHEDEQAGKIGTLYDPTKELAKFQRPPVEILEKYDEEGVQFSAEEINENKVLIQKTLDSFGVKIKKITATIGPTVTLYEIEPEMGVKVARIKSLEDDIAISLKAMSIRLIVPMPGRGTIGIEIPNRSRRTVSMYSMVRSKKFQESKAALPVVIGKTIQNETFVFDLADMPHMIVAGATGQGKSVGLNAIIASLLYKKHPAELKFVMVDPKKVELSLYSKLEKHYLAKMESEDDAILTDTQKVVYTLNSLCGEMEERYKLLRMAGVKRIDAYNQKFLERKLHPKYGHRYLPYLVVVIDEFADMIMTAGKEVETPIVRLGQLARAIGIHLIIATQRPDAKVITGLISANCPARMAFKVTNRINSQIILGGVGAEKLIGKGDMLLQINGAETRLQCAFLDTPEIERIIDFISRQRGYSSAYLLPDYVPEDGGAGEPKEDVGDLDSMFEEVSRFVVANQQGSTSFIQRRFKIGYNRAGRIMDQLEAYGIVGKSEGSKPREVLISDPASLEKLLNDIFIDNLQN